MANSIKSDVKNARKCENINDPIDTYVVDYIAMAFSKLFIKLHIIPNAVTVLSGLVGVAGGVLLCFDSLALDIAGVLLIILSAVFDASDGQVARLTKHYSNLGRTLDGFADFLVYLSIYVAVCVRLFPVNIPFTQTPWSFWIIPVAAVALFVFGAQARAADYFKNLHVFMFTHGNGSELTRTRDIDRQISECKKSSFERFRLTAYRSYTKMQENKTPKVQALLDKIERSESISPALYDEFLAKSESYVKSTNLLTFNLRTIVLFILLFLPSHMEFLYFPFVIFVLEPVRFAIIAKYERLASHLAERDLFGGAEKDD